MFINTLAATSFYQTGARQEVVSFSIPLSLAVNGVFIKNPSHVYNYTLYFDPFTNLSWICISFLLILLLIILYGMAKFRQKASTKITLGDSFFIIYMSLLEKSSTYDPSSLPNRVGFYR